jgi:beta-glucosidase
MVMANNPSNADVSMYAPGAVFAPGGAMPPGGTGIAAWAAMTDGYYAAAQQTRLKVPVLYGLDAVHGNNGATGTVIFPHNAGMASSRDAAFLQQVGQVEAQEILAGGVTWAFGPFAGTTWDYRWGRVYESFSEDPTWAGEMLTALIKGLQGAGGLGSSTPLMTCSKHAAGDGQAGPPGGKPGAVVDRGNAVLTDAQMEQWGLAQYVPAIAAGLRCIMVSDASWNGNNMTQSSHLMTDLVKGQYGFKGFIITDWDAANNMEAVSINAGADMLMAPDDPWQSAITRIANATSISDARINDAVTRILNAKCEAGLFNYKRDTTLIANVGGTDHRALGRKAVAQSLVLLQNNAPADGGAAKVLPLAAGSKVYVGGTGANDIGRQLGGWSISWQGASGNTTTGTTIQQAIAKVATIAPTMAGADAVVIVLSEPPYAEFFGDSLTLNTLPAADLTLLGQARASGKPVVAVVLSGRPVLITSQLANADAWVAAWLPGTEGDGVADILFGTGGVKPTGKLSHSWPSADNQANIKCGMGYGTSCIPGGYMPLFALGFGLSY